MKPVRARWAALALATTVSTSSAEWSGSVAAEARLFPQSAADPDQHGSHLSLAIQPEYYRDWDGGRKGVTIKPFARWDEGDPERTHADVRELLWHDAGPVWEFRAGIGKVFWGVTESQHLVDIVNQTDLVEAPDGESKLGQPMIALARVGEAGIWQFFILPWFRERTFPGEEGRLRTMPRVEVSQPAYQSSKEERHTDWAVRWSHYIGEWDIGLSHFAGTSRDPRLFPGRDDEGMAVLTPYYDLIRQTGLDLQMTRGQWLWKMEWIHRSGQGDAYHAATAGFEHTLNGLMGSRADLGLLAEYLYDDRGEDAPTPFRDAFFLGIRLALNDAASSNLLSGVIWSEAGSLYSLEASRRLSSHLSWQIEGQAFSSSRQESLLSFYVQDDYLRMGLSYHF